MFNLTVASSGGSITMQICTGDGVVHTVQMPLGGSGEGDGNAPGLCCAKGCHNGNSRKRTPAVDAINTIKAHLEQQNNQQN